MVLSWFCFPATMSNGKSSNNRFKPLGRSQKMINPYRVAPKVQAPHARDKATIKRLAMYNERFDRTADGQIVGGCGCHLCAWSIPSPPHSHASHNPYHL